MILNREIGPVDIPAPKSKFLTLNKIVSLRWIVMLPSCVGQRSWMGLLGDFYVAVNRPTPAYPFNTSS